MNAMIDKPTKALSKARRRANRHIGQAHIFQADRAWW